MRVNTYTRHPQITAQYRLDVSTITRGDRLKRCDRAEGRVHGGDTLQRMDSEVALDCHLTHLISGSPSSRHRDTVLSRLKFQHSEMLLFRVPFLGKPNDRPTQYEDRKARFGRHRFMVETAGTVRCVYFFAYCPPLYATDFIRKDLNHTRTLISHILRQQPPIRPNYQSWYPARVEDLLERPIGLLPVQQQLSSFSHL